MTSGYANLLEEGKNFPVPIFFSETGCNVPGPRLFEDQASIFGPDMNEHFSGAIIVRNSHPCFLVVWIT